MHLFWNATHSVFVLYTICISQLPSLIVHLGFLKGTKHLHALAIYILLY
jgi:hypothetical protein